MKSILFVCTGNTCRSPMAEILLKELVKKENKNFFISSVGLQAFNGDSPSSEVVDLLLEKGLKDILSFRSKSVSYEAIKEASYVLVMTQGHRAALVEKYPQYQEKIFLVTEWSTHTDITDPIGRGTAAYHSCYLQIKEALLHFLPFLKNEEDHFYQ